MPQKSPTVDDVNGVIDAWFADQMQKPPISYSVDAYNQAYAAAADLKSRLATLITGEAPAPAPAASPDPEPQAETTKAAIPAGTKE